jgi:hypothetical protein
MLKSVVQGGYLLQLALFQYNREILACTSACLTEILLAIAYSMQRLRSQEFGSLLVWAKIDWLAARDTRSRATIFLIQQKYYQLVQG